MVAVSQIELPLLEDLARELAAAFAMVQVRRSLYRSGHYELRIDEQRCRLIVRRRGSSEPFSLRVDVEPDGTLVARVSGAIPERARADLMAADDLLDGWLGDAEVPRRAGQWGAPGRLRERWG